MKKKILIAVLALASAAFLSACTTQTGMQSPTTISSADTQPPATTSPTDSQPPVATPASTPADVKDEDALYKYVKSEIADIKKESFDAWDKYYYDITGDGSEDVVLVSQYGADFHDKLEIVTGDSGQLKDVAINVQLGADGNTVDFKDGLLAVTVKDGGSGLQYAVMGIYAYDGTKMVAALDNLSLEYSLGTPYESYSEDAIIWGDYSDFTYTLVKFDYINEAQTVEKKSQFTYNTDNMSFEEKTLDPVLSPPSDTDPYNITIDTAGGSLTIQYAGFDDKITLITTDFNYDSYKDGKTITLKNVYVTSAYLDEGDLFFYAKAEGYTGNVYCYVTLDDLKIHFLREEPLPGEDDPVVRLTGFTNETIRGESANYSDYSVVIVPFYPVDGKNYGSLSSKTVEDDFEGQSLYFALFGKLEDVVIYRNDDTNTVSGQWNIGDLENTNVEIMSGLPSDMSYYSIEGNVYVGEGQYVWLRFNLDDMRDPGEYDITFIS